MGSLLSRVRRRGPPTGRRRVPAILPTPEWGGRRNPRGEGEADKWGGSGWTEGARDHPREAGRSRSFRFCSARSARTARRLSSSWA